MERLVCSYCGIPFRSWHAADGGPAYCCSGCAMAARMNISGNSFPVTGQLIYNLAIAFCVFNQLLLLLLGVALANEGRAETAGRFALASAVTGLVVFAGELIWQVRAPLLRRTDAIVFTVAGSFAGSGVVFLSRHAMAAAALAGIASTAIAAFWQTRGVVRKWIRCRVAKNGRA